MLDYGKFVYNEYLCTVIEAAYRKNFVVFDTETTGVDREAEIVQFSAMDKDGKEIMNTKIRPVKATAWPEAQKIHGISPEDVKDAPTLAEIPEIEKIASEYELLVGYNVPFDIRMLVQNGIEVTGRRPSFDIMRAFAPIYGQWNEQKRSYRWQKLQHCAAYYGYAGDGWHDAMADVRATLFCFEQMNATARKYLPLAGAS